MADGGGRRACVYYPHYGGDYPDGVTLVGDLRIEAVDGQFEIVSHYPDSQGQIKSEMVDYIYLLRLLNSMSNHIALLEQEVKTLKGG